MDDGTRWDRNVYSMRGPYLRFPPGAMDSQTIKIRYYRRPSKLVQITEAGKVINVAGNVITLDNLPTTWAVGDKIDIHSGDSPFRVVHDGEEIATISGNDLTIVGDPTIAVGEYVCLEGECVIPQIPYELFPILTTYASLQFLQSYGSAEEVSVLSQNYSELKENLFQLVTPRTTSRPKGVETGAHFRYWR
jgi:hypothetical protein